MVLDLRHYLGQAWFGMFMYVHAFIPLISVAWHKSGHRLPFRAKDYFCRFLRIIIPSNEELSPTVPCNRINRYSVFVRHIMAYHMIYSYFLLAQLLSIYQISTLFFALGIGLHWSFQPTHRLDIFQRKRRSSLHQKEPSVESGSVDFRRSTLRWSSEGVTILKIRFSKKITDADLSQKIFQSFLSFFLRKNNFSFIHISSMFHVSLGFSVQSSAIPRPRICCRRWSTPCWPSAGSCTRNTAGWNSWSLGDKLPQRVGRPVETWRCWFF